MPATTRRLLVTTAVGLVLCAVFAAARAQDLIGIYWDEGFTANQTTTAAPLEIVTGYLVISDPSSGGGILGWECEVTIDGPGTVTAWHLAGQAINAQSPPRFVVGLAAPLPPAAATAVATFDLLVTEVIPVKLGLKPIFFASVPGEMAYLGGDNPEQLTVMTTATGIPTVAWVNEDVPVASVNRISVQFGTIPLGTFADEYVVVTNIGGGLLQLDVSLDCTGPGFSLPHVAGPVALTAGQSVSIPVRFQPVTVDAAECRLLLGDGLPSVPMLGTGREAVVSWTDPPDLLFGARIIGTSTQRTVTLQNTGEVSFPVDVQWLDGCGDFTIVSGGGAATLAPNQFRNVGIRFTPTEEGTWSCLLGFGPGLPEVVVSGSGVYGTPTYTITPPAVDFPLTDVGTTRTQLVQVFNTSAATFTITPSISPAGTPFAVVGAGEPVVVGPFGTHNLLVEFTPPAEEYYTGTLGLGTGLLTVPLTGTGGEAIYDCLVSADTLDFHTEVVGQTQYRALSVENLGNVPLDLIPQIDRPEFTISPANPGRLMPGQTAYFQIAFTSDGVVNADATLVLGPAACTTVALRGRVDIGIEPGENLVGFFFDENFTANETGIGTVGATIPVFLALVNPSNTSGVGGWECRVVIGGEAQFTSVTLAGSAINAGDPNDQSEFAVGIGVAPLPYAAEGVLLATFELLVTDPDPNNVYLQLRPLFQPSLPNLMAWVPWEDFTQLTPMVPITGQPTVAWINTGSPVAVEMPTPLAAQTAGEVVLTWTPRSSLVDGYHVYRRDPTDQERRLTAGPLPATGPVRYVDRPDFPAGTTLHYSYAAVQGGREIAHSPEVTVVVSGVPSLATGLLANVPNPFNPETRIRYRIARPGPVRITVYDVTGRLVRTLLDERQAAGERDVIWRGRDDSGRVVASGAYYVRLETPDRVDHRKVMMLK